MVKDDWVAAAMIDEQMVVELLTQLKSADTVASENPAANLSPSRWGIRRRRSKSSRFGGRGVFISLKKDLDSTKASPKNPLSWSGRSRSGGGYRSGGGSSTSTSATTSDRFENTSLQASCSTSTGSGSMGFHIDEISSIFPTKLKIKKLSCSKLKEKEKLKEKKRHDLEKEIKNLQPISNEQSVKKQNLKKITLHLNPAHYKNKKPVSKTEPESKSCEVEDKTGRSENKKRIFLLPDLNLVPSDDEML